MVDKRVVLVIVVLVVGAILYVTWSREEPERGNGVRFAEKPFIYFLDPVRVIEGNAVIAYDDVTYIVSVEKGAPGIVTFQFRLQNAGLGTVSDIRFRASPEHPLECATWYNNPFSCETDIPPEEGFGIPPAHQFDPWITIDLTEDYTGTIDLVYADGTAVPGIGHIEII